MRGEPGWASIGWDRNRTASSGDEAKIARLFAAGDGVFDHPGGDCVRVVPAGLRVGMDRRAVRAVGQSLEHRQTWFARIGHSSAAPVPVSSGATAAPTPAGIWCRGRGVS